VTSVQSDPVLYAVTMPAGSISLSGATATDLRAPLCCWPAYLVYVMGGRKGLMGALPAVVVCGVLWGGVQFLIAWYVGPYLASMVSALVTMVGLVVLLLVWKPKDHFALVKRPIRSGRHQAPFARRRVLGLEPLRDPGGHGPPVGRVQAELNKVSVTFPWPGLTKW